jgi:type I restriction enzyme S subunit
MKRSAYSEYRPSAMMWLKEIPTQWTLRKLKHVASVNFSSVDKHTFEGEEPVRLCNYVDVYYNDYITPDLSFMEATASNSEIRRFTLKRGDVLVTKDSEEWNDIAVSSYVVNDLPGVLCGYHLAHIRSNSECMDGKYLSRAFSALGINDQFRVEATGITRYGLGKYGLDNAFFPVPPLETQHAIAAFLDRETERIDTLIAKKERQIELLQEKRAALISHVVTKGLNPNAKMKDSGIEWLGEIPEHWTITRFKYALWLQRGHDLPATDFCNGVYPVCGSNGCIGYHDHFTTKGPGVTVGRSGSVGEVNYIEQDYWAHNTALYIKEFRRTRPKYAFYLLKALDVKYLSEGSAVGTLNRNYIHDLPVAIPSTSEQEAIIAFMDRETIKLQGLIEKIRTSIQALGEYRTALISAAVTGKIDVRKEFTR